MPITGYIYDKTPSASNSRYAVYGSTARSISLEEAQNLGKPKAEGGILEPGNPVANILAVKTFLESKSLTHIGMCEEGVGWKWGDGKDKGNENQKSEKLELDFSDRNATVANEKAAMAVRSSDMDIAYLDELNLEFRLYLNIPNSIKREGKGGDKKKIPYHLELDTFQPENYEVIHSLA